MIGFRRLFAGLSIGARHVSFALLARRGSVCRLAAAQSVELPEGLIHLSPAKPNLSDPRLLRERMGGIIQSLKGIRRISLGLPDPCARATILSADGRSVQGRDLDELVRWQMEKRFLSSLADTRVTHQLLPGRGNGILGVAVRHQILGEYEGLVRGMGIEPIRVGVSSFQIYNLYHDLMLQQAGPAGRFIALNIFEGSFTLMIFMKGVMEFVRIKSLQPTSSAGASSLSGQRSLSDLIMEEMDQSMKFYGQYTDPSDITHIFVFGRGVSEFIKRAHDQYHVEVEPLEPERLGGLRGMEQIRPEEVPLVTPAIAAALDGLRL